MVLYIFIEENYSLYIFINENYNSFDLLGLFWELENIGLGCKYLNSKFAIIIRNVRKINQKLYTQNGRTSLRNQANINSYLNKKWTQ